jgi:hypothetical protein
MSPRSIVRQRIYPRATSRMVRQRHLPVPEAELLGLHELIYRTVFDA